MAYVSEDLSRRGFAVWNIEYRRVGGAGGGYPGTFEDVGRGIDRLRTIAQAEHLDLRRVVLVGHSAGGQLALWAAARRRLPRGDRLYRPDPLPVAGVVSLAELTTWPPIARMVRRLAAGRTPSTSWWGCRRAEGATSMLTPRPPRWSDRRASGGRFGSARPDRAGAIRSRLRGEGRAAGDAVQVLDVAGADISS